MDMALCRTPSPSRPISGIGDKYDPLFLRTIGSHEEAAAFLIGRGSDDVQLLKNVPPNEFQNKESTFIVDVSSLKSPGDLKVDEMGAWGRPSQNNSFWKKQQGSYS
ncbi:MAG: hypothetical protein GY820_15900 [Gammaproteobacteria bacterium]|nr:hypothetical protein [Gammaproteobacteria bacterium]